MFELFLLITQHGVSAEDFRHLFNLFDAEHSPVVYVTFNSSGSATINVAYF